MRLNLLWLTPWILAICSVCPATVDRSAISPEWLDKKADVYFALDSSVSLWIGEYKKMLEFVTDMVKEMDIGPDKTRVGIGLYSNDFSQFLPINNGHSKERLLDIIKDAPYSSGIRYLSKAIEGVMNTGLSPTVTRKGVPLITVLFTGGGSRHRHLTVQYAEQAKEAGIFIYTIEVRGNTDGSELRNIASDPKSRYAYLVHDFSSFNTIKQKLMTSISEVQFLQGDEGTCGKRTNADIVFVYDEFTLGQDNSSVVRSFIKSLVKEFSMDSGNIRISILSKTCHQGDITLGEYLTQAELLKAMDSQRGPSVKTLLRKARLEGFELEVGSRLNAQKRIVLIMQGQITDTYRLLDEARRANLFGIEIYVLAVEIQFDKETLEQMTSDKSFVFHVDSIRDLQSKARQFLDTFCRELN